MAVGYYRKLVEILVGHHLKRFADRSVGRHSSNLIQRSHNIADCSVGPPSTLHRLNFMWCDYSLRLRIKGDDNTSFSGTYEILIDQSLQVGMSIHRHVISRHHIYNTDTAKALGNRHLRVALARSIKQEPANKRDPQTIKAGASKESHESEDNHSKGDKLAHA